MHSHPTYASPKNPLARPFSGLLSALLLLTLITPLFSSAQLPGMVQSLVARTQVSHGNEVMQASMLKTDLSVCFYAFFWRLSASDSKIQPFISRKILQISLVRSSDHKYQPQVSRLRNELDHLLAATPPAQLAWVPLA